MNTRTINPQWAAALLPVMLVACSDSNNNGGSSPDPDPEPSISVVQRDSADANGINGIVHASSGIYAIGYSDQDDDRTVILGYNADGSVNTDFGTDGTLSLNIKIAGGAGSPGDEVPYGIVELTDGDLLFVVNAADANGDGGDVDAGQSVYLVRLDADNDFAIDADYGDDGGAGSGLAVGVQEIVFGWANADNGTFPDGFPSDTAYDLLLDSSGDEERVVVNGYGPAANGETFGGAQATDRDRYVTRLMADDGTVDAGFNGGTAFTYSTPRGENSTDNARRASLEADGSILSVGYTNFGDDQSNHVVLIKLAADGTLDTDFGGFVAPTPLAIPGQDGIAVFNPFRAAGGFAEAYAAVAQSDGDYVTTGYGRANGGTAPETGPLSSYDDTEENDLVAFRVLDGTGLDPDYGNPDEPGTQAIQSEGTDPADAEEISTEERGRDMVMLPDDRSVHVGYYGGVPAIYVLTADGEFDTSVDDDGLILLPHDEVTNTDAAVEQQFFTAELSADGKLAIGTRANDPAGVRFVLIDGLND